MVRFVSLVYPVMLGLLVVTFLVGIYRVTETDALLPPVLFDPPTVTRGAWSILYAFVGVESTSTLIACVKAPKHPYRYGFTALGVNFSLLTLILVITLGIWGVVPAAQVTYPGAVTLRTLRLSGLLVERIGGFVAITWTMLELTFVTTQLLEFARGIATAVGAGPERYRYFLIPLSLYMLAMARLPGNPRELEMMITRVVTPMTAGTWLLLVPLLLVLGLIRKRRNAAS
jgi:hypothetical protein